MRRDRRQPGCTCPRSGASCPCGQGGFSLIELLIVILILAILVAIAIPSFLSQTGKAYDSSAKELARTAQTSMESYAIDHGGDYCKGLSEAKCTEELKSYEAGLPSCPASANACFKSAKEIESGKGYEVTAVANNTEDEFTIKREAGGEVSRSCNSPKLKNGCAGAQTGTW